MRIKTHLVIKTSSILSLVKLHLISYFRPDSRGVANGIFSWGIYFGYGLAYIYGKYLTRWVPRPLMRSTTFTRQVPRQRGRARVRVAGLLRGGRRTRHPHRPRHPPRDQVAAVKISHATEEKYFTKIFNRETRSKSESSSDKAEDKTLSSKLAEVGSDFWS